MRSRQLFWVVLICVAILSAFVLFVQPANGTECMEDEPCWDCETMGNQICGPTGGVWVQEPVLVVDGAVYYPSKISGPTVHFETPDTDPFWAYSWRHTWTGHGSENLPCPGGIHWIDNENVLTVSHCLPETTTTTSTSTTTTTVPITTTTTTVPVTTTTVPSSTTTTVPETTTTTSTIPTTTTTATTTTTVPPTTTTTIPELPKTGIPTIPALLAGIGLLILGSATIAGTKRR